MDLQGNWLVPQVSTYSQFLFLYRLYMWVEENWRQLQFSSTSPGGETSDFIKFGR